MSRKSIQRYSAPERVLHWGVALTFGLLALSGMALFHPALYWLTHLLGGGPWTRMLHPFFGLVMVFLFAWLALRMHHHNRMTPADWQWLRQWRDVATRREGVLPEVGRFNGGQKLLFWVLIACMGILLVSGMVLWQPYFAPHVHITFVRWGAVLHALTAFVSILGILIHVYAALWVKGTLGAMIRGVVTRAWARKHHPGWLREVERHES